MSADCWKMAPQGLTWDELNPWIKNCTGNRFSSSRYGDTTSTISLSNRPFAAVFGLKIRFLSVVSDVARLFTGRNLKWVSLVSKLLFAIKTHEEVTYAMTEYHTQDIFLSKRCSKETNSSRYLACLISSHICDVSVSSPMCLWTPHTQWSNTHFWALQGWWFASDLRVFCWTSPKKKTAICYWKKKNPEQKPVMWILHKFHLLGRLEIKM